MTSVTENRELLQHHLVYFQQYLEYQKRETPDEPIYKIVSLYLDNEENMEAGMRAYADYENECYKYNARILKAIKNTKGKTFSLYLKQIIEESDNVVGKMEIVKEPTGKFQEESFGRTIKGIWVNQRSVGDSGDSWEGEICVEIKPSKYLRFSYSM